MGQKWTTFGRWGTLLLEGSQAMPARRSDKDRQSEDVMEEVSSKISRQIQRNFGILSNVC
jgi:tetrahydromethanopterin S-methyltransferase subunit G